MLTSSEMHLKFQSREQNQEEPQIRAFMKATGCYFMAHTLRKNGSVIKSKLTEKIPAELAMQIIAIAIALRPYTGFVLIEKNETKRSVKS